MTNLDDTRDVVNVLREQHQVVRDLMRSVRAAAPAARAEPFAALVRLLAVHETAEEMVVYPALERNAGPEGTALADARRREEDEAKKVLADLEKLDPASPEFVSMFSAFTTAVEAHASAEERDVFPLLARTTSAEDLRALAVQLQVAESVAPTHPHKSAPEGAVGNLFVGPFVSMVDRVRDLFRDVARH